MRIMESELILELVYFPAYTLKVYDRVWKQDEQMQAVR